MFNPTAREKVILFDTTLRDGELMAGVDFSGISKLKIAELLANMGVDIIEVSYPSQSTQDFRDFVTIARKIDKATICALTGDKETEIRPTIAALEKAKCGRLHLYHHINLTDRLRQKKALAAIAASIRFTKNHSDDIEWTAFDATRAPFDFLCQAVEKAIASGATTINIADSLGVATPDTFSQLIVNLQECVPHCDRCILSVHCHDDLGLAVDNSLAALEAGARQIECAVNGLGARKGNANLAEIVKGIEGRDRFYSHINADLLPAVSQLVERSIINRISS